MQQGSTQLPAINLGIGRVFKLRSPSVTQRGTGRKTDGKRREELEAERGTGSGERDWKRREGLEVGRGTGSGERNWKWGEELEVGRGTGSGERNWKRERNGEKQETATQRARRVTFTIAE